MLLNGLMRAVAAAVLVMTIAGCSGGLVSTVAPSQTHDALDRAALHGRMTIRNDRKYPLRVHVDNVACMAAVPPDTKLSAGASWSGSIKAANAGSCAAPPAFSLTFTSSRPAPGAQLGLEYVVLRGHWAALFFSGPQQTMCFKFTHHKALDVVVYDYAGAPQPCL